MSMLFTPNAKVKHNVSLALFFGWLGVIFAFWLVQPFPIIPKPWEVISALGEQWQEGLGVELMTSMITSLEAIAVATVVGLSLAYLSVIPLFRPFVELIGKLRFLSLTGMIVIFIIMAPDGHALKVSVLVFAMVTFYVHNMLATIDAIPESRYDHARTLSLTELEVTREVVMRGTLAEAFENLRGNAAMAWMMLTMVEGLSRSEGGVGVLLLNLNRVGEYDAIFAIQIIILFMGIGQDWLIKAVKRVVCPYAKG